VKNAENKNEQKNPLQQSVKFGIICSAGIVLAV